MNLFTNQKKTHNFQNKFISTRGATWIERDKLGC